MKSRGNCQIYNKQIEEQTNIIKRNEADIEIKAKQDESFVKKRFTSLASKRAECIQNTEEEFLNNWNRTIEWSEDGPTPSQDTNTEETIPILSLEEQGSTKEYSEMADIVKNVPDSKSNDSPRRNDMTKEEAGNANTEELEMNSLSKCYRMAKTNK
ncbi:unnamed protein product [Mytilus edulis]|uniref:Uncharacterized protein n=1 Tax=Mytilus edulis TaxID=6550 RepID=A0A8S3SBB3_MYTED|nr:unnamed protein product [Mytilus edulis]